MGGVLEVCGECYNIGYIDRPVVFILSPSPLYYVFENSENKKNDLARPVMGTIFLVTIRRRWYRVLEAIARLLLFMPLHDLLRVCLLFSKWRLICPMLVYGYLLILHIGHWSMQG